MILLLKLFLLPSMATGVPSPQEPFLHLGSIPRPVSNIPQHPALDKQAFSPSQSAYKGKINLVSQHLMTQLSPQIIQVRSVLFLSNSGNWLFYQSPPLTSERQRVQNPALLSGTPSAYTLSRLICSSN